MYATKTPPQIVSTVSMVRGDVFRVPVQYATIRVITGRAWVTSGGRDHLLSSEDRFRANHSADSVIVEAIGDEMLVIELLENNPRRE
jgi:hypothetical protein